MLLNYLKRTEAVLKALSDVVEDVGHSDHKGTPREFFVSNFLEELVGEAFGIGTGEIIDADSKPKQKRNQIDIVIYQKHFPKLSLGGDCYAFFAESVIATIEVKSNLTEEKLTESLDSIAAVKKLKQNRVYKTTDYHPPGIVSYIFAYKGQTLPTTLGHVKAYMAHKKIAKAALPKTLNERMSVACPLADCICVLNRGTIHYDNSIYEYIDKGDEERSKNPKHCWVSMQDSALFWLYLHLTSVLLAYSPDGMLDPWPYLKDVERKWTFDE